MANERNTNLLGAFVLGAADVLTKGVETTTGCGETPAALVSIGAEPGLSVTALQFAINFSHPGTVRLVDRLVAEGLVERRGERTVARLHYFSHQPEPSAASMCSPGGGGGSNTSPQPSPPPKGRSLKAYWKNF